MSLRMARSQVGLADSPALCAVPTSHLTRCQEHSQRLWWVCASVETLPTPLRKGREGAKRRKVGEGSRTPKMRCPQGLWGLALPEPLRRFCSHCASLGSAWKRRELRFARLAVRRDGGAGECFLPPTRTATLQCSPFAPTLTRDSSAKAPGDRSLPEALAGNPEQLAKIKNKNPHTQKNKKKKTGRGGEAGPVVRVWW